MKKIIVLILLTYFYPAVLTNAQAVVSGSSKSIKKVFDGRTPCQELAIQLKKPAGPECIKMKWRLTLITEPASAVSGTFSMEGYGFRGENTLRGSWKQASTTTAKIIELDLGERGKLFLQNLDNAVLFFLDEKKNLLVGNKDFSYALYLNKDKSAL